MTQNEFEPITFLIFPLRNLGPINEVVASKNPTMCKVLSLHEPNYVTFEMKE